MQSPELQEWIRQVVATWRPLSEVEIARLRQLLLPVAREMRSRQLV